MFWTLRLTLAIARQISSPWATVLEKQIAFSGFSRFSVESLTYSVATSPTVVTPAFSRPASSHSPADFTATPLISRTGSGGAVRAECFRTHSRAGREPGRSGRTCQASARPFHPAASARSFQRRSRYSAANFSLRRAETRRVNAATRFVSLAFSSASPSDPDRAIRSSRSISKSRAAASASAWN